MLKKIEKVYTELEIVVLKKGIFKDGEEFCAVSVFKVDR